MATRKNRKGTFAVEVTNVSPQGIWLLFDEVEHFLSFEKFPWFREATIGALTLVERPQSHHLYWPELDVDLHVDSVVEPERFPLVSRTKINGKTVPAKARKRKGT